jgi:glycogen operon protein
MADRRRLKLPGQPFPLGSHWDGDGVNFAVYSEAAESMFVCLFDPVSRAEVDRVPLTQKDGHVWHNYLPGLKPGQLYGLRAGGPHRPLEGLRFNVNKLLVDPYARCIVGDIDWTAPVWGFDPGASDADLSFDPRDDAHGVPKCLVIDDTFEWQHDRHPYTPWHRSVIYEVHVKGATIRHPEVPLPLRGTYRGLASEPMLRHLKRLGVTAVELLPVHSHLDAKFLRDHGLTNYWGYDSLNFFAPDARYSSRGDRGGQVTDFKEMVRTFHQNGIEVILDVVYNHTVEANHLGPTLSLRGLDNQTYYRLKPGEERYYVDYTGTGNTLNVRHRQSLTLIMDSLRYWVQEMHVDGFRFDLAASLARELHEVSKLSSFFDTIHQDPVISQVKLIAEPWDVGEGGYQVGNFPVLWTEWNGKYRDAVRRFWRGDESHAREMAYRLTGSSDLYDRDGRHPHASINFVTAHDGFTLQDLVGYSHKHNEANGENNQDGMDENLSWNFGIEGPTDDPAIIERRERQKRSLMATLLLSQGVPMICGGDELSRTQHGNNNAYAQDNEISWFDWELDDRRGRFLSFVVRLLRERQSHPSLQRRSFFLGRPLRGSEIKDVTWLRTDGQEMDDIEWSTVWLRCFGMRLDGSLNDVDDLGEPLNDDVLLLLLNADESDIDFTLPAPKQEAPWLMVLDTARPEVMADTEKYASGKAYRLAARSLALLRTPNGSPTSLV